MVHGRGAQLFTVMLWLEEPEPGCREYRGEAVHPLTGARRAFRDWATMQAFLVELVERDPSTSVLWPRPGAGSDPGEPDAH